MKTVTVGSAEELRRLLPGRPEERALLGIVGPPGAGKSTVTAAIAALAPSSFTQVPMDGFHLADRVLDSRGLLGRKGAPETFDAHGFAALLTRLRGRPDHAVYAPAFERTLDQPLANALEVPASSSLLITEGNYLLLDAPGWREAREQLDAVWFIHLDPPVRRRRLVARHMEFGKSADAAEQWVLHVDEPNADLVESTRCMADLVLDCSGWRPTSRTRC